MIYQFIALYKQLQNKSTSAFIMAYIYYDKRRIYPRFLGNCYKNGEKMVDLFDAKVVCLNGFSKIQEFCTF